MRQNDFVGFNVQQLYSNLLKFHYHQNGGILYAADGFVTYSTVFLTQLESACSPLLPSHMLPWMRWSRQVLGNVVNIIGLYCGRHLFNYLIEDKNRVSFLAFEFVLRHLDALTLPVVENWDTTLLLELRLIFITCHTNNSYETGIRTLFLSDQQLSSAFLLLIVLPTLRSPLTKILIRGQQLSNHLRLRHLRVEHLLRQFLMMSIYANFK